MQSLVLTVVFCAALSALNLLLTFGVLRRLREHDQALARSGGARTSGVATCGPRLVKSPDC